MGTLARFLFCSSTPMYSVAVNTSADMNTKSSSRFGLTLGTTDGTRRRHGRFRNRHFTQAEFRLSAKVASAATHRECAFGTLGGILGGGRNFASDLMPLGLSNRPSNVRSTALC